MCVEVLVRAEGMTHTLEPHATPATPLFGEALAAHALASRTCFDVTLFACFIFVFVFL